MKSLHLAGPEDLDRLLPLVAGFHAERGNEIDADHIGAALAPLLEGQPHGAVWLIGPRKAPVGYVAVSFGWSLQFGGLDATVNEIFIRAAVRRRGMGGEALDVLAKGLRDSGITALHIEVDRDDEGLQRFYRRARFRLREQTAPMTRAL
ncbi:GNAT family N-acetyltransferase [Salipiger mucosus]|uniref:Acetyltransferase, GNAT family protein n=1 Tax=Salipiger mucosus DSM 16094 TaxID=1123237 RepID=S9QFU0_9RHOB|nr:GNAT family N-acetyltransferase [Salipiger mucosus]EPX78468.1 acetyltransferase, GNAT family protein [Salipiger mucosus DSM 16094]